MPDNYLTPINRNNLFYSEEDFDFETDLVMGYLEEDVNQTIILYEVDRDKTELSSVYQETSGNIRFKTPKEIPCLFEISDSELKSYDSSNANGAYTVGGNLTAYIPTKVFEKYQCDIKRGDYIGVQIDTNRIVYYAVVNDGKLNTSNKLYIGAYKTAFRVVVASVVDENEFNGL